MKKNGYGGRPQLRELSPKEAKLSQTSWLLLFSELCSFFWNKKNLESHKKVCENKGFCNVTMPSEDIKVLEFNQYQKSDKASFIIYADIGYRKEKIDRCKNNPENHQQQK